MSREYVLIYNRHDRVYLSGNLITDFQEELRIDDVVRIPHMTQSGLACSDGLRHFNRWP